MIFCSVSRTLGHVQLSDAKFKLKCKKKIVVLKISHISNAFNTESGPKLTGEGRPKEDAEIYLSETARFKGKIILWEICIWLWVSPYY